MAKRECADRRVKSHRFNRSHTCGLSHEFGNHPMVREGGVEADVGRTADFVGGDEFRPGTLRPVVKRKKAVSQTYKKPVVDPPVDCGAVNRVVPCSNLVYVKAAEGRKCLMKVKEFHDYISILMQKYIISEIFPRNSRKIFDLFEARRSILEASGDSVMRRNILEASGDGVVRRSVGSASCRRGVPECHGAHPVGVVRRSIMGRILSAWRAGVPWGASCRRGVPECHGAYPVGVMRQNGFQWIVTIVAPKPYSWNEASR